MLLNHNKFELIQFKPTNNNKSLSLLQNLPFSEIYSYYQLPNDEYLQPSNVVKDLGIHIDNKLDWNVHIFQICNKARRTSGWILNTFKSRDRVTMTTLFNSLIRPILEYNCEIWSPFKLKDINEIENIQRSFTHRIKGMTEKNYWERLESLKIESLQRRREKIAILNVWKMEHKLTPNSVNFSFKFHERSQSNKAILPPLPKTNCRLLNKYEESFAIKGAKLWNILPPTLTRIPNINIFKSSLKTFLGKLPDKPPLDGYSRTNNNSLLEIAGISR